MILIVAMTCLCGFTQSGCQKDASTSNNGAEQFALAEPEGEEQDDGNEAAKWGEDHPEHGPRGGHMIELSNDQKTEVHFDEEAELFTVYIDDLGDVRDVQMTTTSDGETTVYEFERTETPGGTLYGLLNSELAEAVMQEDEEIEVKLQITTADGELTADYEYFPH